MFLGIIMIHVVSKLFLRTYLGSIDFPYHISQIICSLVSVIRYQQNFMNR